MKLFAKQISKLNLRNREYRKFVDELLEFLWREDSASGDTTTKLLKNPRQKIKAEVTAKSAGVLAGATEVEFFWQKKGIETLTVKKDGSKIKVGETIFKISGPAEKILAAERVGLNLLSRMSGIATATTRLAKKIGKNKLSATRKTPLGLLDSKAVVIGGGLPHRLNLADQILVKENHLAVDPDCWKKIKTKDFFEVEADSTKLAIEIATYFSNSRNLVLLLDNFSPARLKKLVPRLKKINPKIILEASGGITNKSAKQYLKTGVDYVSLGALTHSVAVLDFSLIIV